MTTLLIENANLTKKVSFQFQSFFVIVVSIRLFWFYFRSFLYNGMYFLCFSFYCSLDQYQKLALMPTILYLTKKRARLTRSSFITYQTSLGLSGGCEQFCITVFHQLSILGISPIVEKGTKKGQKQHRRLLLLRRGQERAFFNKTKRQRFSFS